MSNLREFNSRKRQIIIRLIVLLGWFLCGTAWAQDRPKDPGICPQPRNTPTAPDEYLSRVNPLEATESNLLAGQTLFHVDARPGPCRTCHGTSGNGLGITFHQLQPKPRNFTCYQTMQDLPDGQLFWIIRNGSPDTAMPAFVNLDDDQIWQLILYLRSLSK